MKEEIRKILLSSGAQAVGFSKAGEIDIYVHEGYKDWIQKGWHGEMEYLRRHISLRQHTDSVLSGAKTIISLAFSYVPQKYRPINLPSISSYAYGDDYHIILRAILKPFVKEIQLKYGGKWRICIDSAPIAERYWAMKSGIGKRGVNGSIIVEGCGGLCFLVEIITTLDIHADAYSDISSDISCKNCGICKLMCPGKAIKGDGTIDSRKCLNYLTIEKKSELSMEEKEMVSSGSGFLYGCDKCLRVCPHNSQKLINPTSNFLPNKEILSLTPEKILKMDESTFKTLFSSSPLLYGSYTKLRRNALTIKTRRTGNN